MEEDEEIKRIQHELILAASKERKDITIPSSEKKIKQSFSGFAH
jgi:hypothetical protein